MLYVKPHFAWMVQLGCLEWMLLVGIPYGHLFVQHLQIYVILLLWLPDVFPSLLLTLWLFNLSLANSHLFAFDKNPGVRPIGIGESSRHLISKAILTVL